MSRNLSPSKIVLLLLIDLYMTGPVPARSRSGVLRCIKSALIASPNPDDTLLDGRLELLTSDIDAFSPSLSKLAYASGRQSIYDGLLKRVWQLDGVNTLFVFFDHLGQTVAPAAPRGVVADAQTSPGSPAGRFVRRSHLEFARLQWVGVKKLWDSFCQYRQSSHDRWARTNPNAARWDGSKAQPGWALARSAVTHHTRSAPVYTSADDKVAILHFSIQRLQSSGSRVPAAVRAKLDAWLSHHQWESQPQSLRHYMAFFDHWRAGRYGAALENLHRYFDCTVMGRPEADNMRLYYQYALLHLSILHADFGKWDESADAMEECVATALENQDDACLNFALSWLVHMRRTYPPTGDDDHAADADVNAVRGSEGGGDDIAFLKARAREDKNWALLSSFLLEEAKLCMHSGRNTSQAWEHLLQSGYLSVRFSGRALMPAIAMFQSVSCDRLGQAHVGRRLYEDLVLLDGALWSNNDRAYGACRASYDLAKEGRYDEAVDVLRRAKSGARGLLKLGQRFDTFAVVVGMMACLQRRNVESYELALPELQPSTFLCDTELPFPNEHFHLQLLIKRKEFEKAHEAVNAQLAKLKGAKGGLDVAQRIRLLVFRSRIFVAGGKPIKAFSLALRAASVAKRFLLVTVLVDALAVLADALNCMGEFAAARDLIEAAIPFALEANDRRTTGRLFAQLAELYVGVSQHETEERQTRSLQMAEVFVDRGAEAYAEVKDVDGVLDCQVMKGRLARWRGDEASAARTDDAYTLLSADASVDFMSDDSEGD